VSGGITATVVFIAIMLLLPAFQGLPKPVRKKTQTIQSKKHK